MRRYCDQDNYIHSWLQDMPTARNISDIDRWSPKAFPRVLSSNYFIYSIIIHFHCYSNSITLSLENKYTHSPQTSTLSRRRINSYNVRFSTFARGGGLYAVIKLQLIVVLRCSLQRKCMLLGSSSVLPHEQNKVSALLPRSAA